MEPQGRPHEPGAWPEALAGRSDGWPDRRCGCLRRDRGVALQGRGASGRVHALGLVRGPALDIRIALGNLAATGWSFGPDRRMFPCLTSAAVLPFVVERCGIFVRG